MTGKHRQPVRERWAGIIVPLILIGGPVGFIWCCAGIIYLFK